MSHLGGTAGALNCLNIAFSTSSETCIFRGQMSEQGKSSSL